MVNIQLSYSCRELLVKENNSIIQYSCVYLTTRIVQNYLFIYVLQLLTSLTLTCENC